MQKLILSFLVIFLTASYVLRAQNTLFMLHAVTDCKMYAGNSKGLGADINRFKSYNYTLGMDAEYKYSAFVGSGLGLYYERNAFSLTQNQTKLFPNANLHQKEFIITDGIAPEVFMSFYFSKKGETGLFLKLAASTDFVLGRKHRMLDTAAPLSGFSETETKFYDVEYLSKLHYSVKVAFGYKSLALSINYRISDIVAESFQTVLPAEFAKLSIGLSAGILFLDR